MIPPKIVREDPKPEPSPRRLTLEKSDPLPLAPRIIINGVEGWGKTTLAAYAPDTAIIMAPNENGYETLLSAGLVPNIVRTSVNSWKELLDVLVIPDHQLRTYKT